MRIDNRFDPWDHDGEAIKQAKKYRDAPQCPYSNYRVGAAVISRNKEGQIKVFGAQNIEISNANGIHAEKLAALKAISEGYIYIEKVYVIHDRPTEGMCGYCRQDIMYFSRDCIMNIIDEEGNIIVSERLVDTIKHPYMGISKIVK